MTAPTPELKPCPLKEFYLEHIRNWKYYWLTSEPGYETRAIGVDANMIHHLASRLSLEPSPTEQALAARVEELEAEREAILACAHEQAEDEGLWSVPAFGTQPISEAYLQQELRNLHRVIEEQSSGRALLAELQALRAVRDAARRFLPGLVASPELWGLYKYHLSQAFIALDALPAGDEGEK